MILAKIWLLVQPYMHKVFSVTPTIELKSIVCINKIAYPYFVTHMDMGYVAALSRLYEIMHCYRAYHSISKFFRLDLIVSYILSINIEFE
jgi:enoyl reductase-like protein